MYKVTRVRFTIRQRVESVTKARMMVVRVFTEAEEKEARSVYAGYIKEHPEMYFDLQRTESTVETIKRSRTNEPNTKPW